MLVIQRERGSGTKEDPIQVRFWTNRKDGAKFSTFDKARTYRRITREQLRRASDECVPGDRLTVLHTIYRPMASDHFHASNAPCSECDLYFVDEFGHLTNARRHAERQY